MLWNRRLYIYGLITKIIMAEVNIKDFVKQTIEQAQAAVEEAGYLTCSEQESSIRFEVEASASSTADGGLKVYVVSAGAGSSNTSSQRIVIFAKKRPCVGVA
jgi:hypothetical protein